LKNPNIGSLPQTTYDNLSEPFLNRQAGQADSQRLMVTKCRFSLGRYGLHARALARYRIDRKSAEAAKTESNIPGFGKFKVKETPEREGRNPSTGATIKLRPRRS
jgi:hypothetical protein